MPNTLRLLRILIFLGILLIPASVIAQTISQIENFEVALWPEYDRASVLVIYRVRLSSTSSLPATVQLPIPAEVGEPHVVAKWYPDGGLDDEVTWTSEVEGDWRMVEIQTDTTGVWLEFYADLDVEGQVRGHTFHWPGGVEIENFTFEVLHPLGAQDVKTDPPGELGVSFQDQVTTVGEIGPLTAGESIDLELTYSRPTTWLTPNYQPSEPTLPIDSLNIALWPEFDRSSVLVIYQARLSPTTSLPAVVQLPIPAEVGEPHVVAKWYPDGGRDDEVTWTSEVEGDWRMVEIQTDTPGVWLEYYHRLPMDGDARTFTFLWPGGVTLGGLVYEIQHPIGASEVRVTPPGSVQLEEDDLVYTRRNLGPQSSPSSVSLSLFYLKPNLELTVDALPTQSIITRPDSSQGGTPDLTRWLPWVIGLSGLLLISFGGFLYIRDRRQQSQAPQRARGRRRTRGKGREQGEEIDASPVFCHVCGTQAGASDHYCRRCGTELRQ